MPARLSLMTAFVAFIAGATDSVRAQHAAPPPEPGSFILLTQPPSREEAERETRRTRLPTGGTPSVWAAEPDVIHPVRFDITDDGTVQKYDRKRIRSRERGHSAMPSGLAETLGRRQLRDLVEFLRTLR